jgi:hypothetical protein
VKTESTIKQLIIAASITPMLVAFVIFGARIASAQPALNTPQNPDVPVRVRAPQEYLKSIDDLMHERLAEERGKYGSALEPEFLKLEANYVRTDAPTGEIVMHEASFHLEPHYMSFSPGGISHTDSVPTSRQPVMYFTGSARTPLALPLVSNLSKVLSGDEASYTVYLGILPLPAIPNSKSDSIRYYVVIERAVESNKSESEQKLERYAKEFIAKPGDPIRLHLDNTPPEGQHIILKIEDNATLNFYEDFARHFKEDILLNGEHLRYELRKADLSALSSRLSIPYTIAKTCAVKLDLLSVVDPAHPLTLIDSVMPPADYLAEKDMKPFTNGTYQYRLVAKELGSGKILFEETKSFEKKSAMIVSNVIPLASDTLEVGGKKEDARKVLQALNQAKTVAEISNDRLKASLENERLSREQLEKELKAKESNTIAGLRVRTGGGFGQSTGVNLFVGVESAVPSLTLDLSYGFLNGSIPYLAWETAPVSLPILKNPTSLGVQLGWSPISFLNGVIKPVLRFGFYGIVSSITPATVNGIHSATLFAPHIGIMSTPGGSGSNFGADLSLGYLFGLGIHSPAQFDWQVKFYTRF